MDPRANLFPFVLICDARQLALLLVIDPIVYKTTHETQEGGRTGGLRVEGADKELGHRWSRQCGDAKEYHHVCRCRVIGVVIGVVNKANRRCFKKILALCQPFTTCQ